MDAQITFKTNDGEIKLVRQYLAEGKVSMRLPDTFQDLPKDTNKEVKGHIIESSKSNEENTAVFTMLSRVLDDKSTKMIEEEYIKMAVAGFRQVFSRVAPGYQEIGVFNKVVNDHLVGCINFFSHGIKSEMFQIFAVLRSGHNLYQCNFTCLDKDADVWNLIFLACIDSLKIVDEQ